MEELNNSESEIFKNTLEKQKKFITERLNKIKNKYLDDDFIVAPQKTENIKQILVYFVKGVKVIMALDK